MEHFGIAIGKALKQLRKERNFTQGDVCRISGIDRNSYQRIDSGNTPNPTMINLVKIAEALDTTPGDIIDRAYKLYKDSIK